MISYNCGKYDILREEELDNLDRVIQKAKEEGVKYFALGIYDDSVCEALNVGKPLKTLEQRMEIMSQIRGVDFVFPVYSLDPKLIQSSLKNSFQERQNKEDNNKNNNKEKEYEVAYAPGTYDLFHSGHLENLMIAASNSEKLIVGVKADELVQVHKHKKTQISEKERMGILRHFKFVDDVYLYYTRDLHVARDWIKSKYGSLDAVFMGSDLKEDFKDVKDINIIFTDRPPEKMKNISSTAYKKRVHNNYKKTNGRYTCTTVKITDLIKDEKDNPSQDDNKNRNDD